MSRDLVVCSLEAWDDVWRRNQFLVAGLLERDPGLRVLFVEPARDPIHDLRSRRMPRRGGGLRTVPGYGPGRLHALHLTKWLPRVAGGMADRSLRAGIDRAVRRLDMAHPVLWVNDPGWAGLVEATGWAAMYDITDDWLLADRHSRTHDRAVANEQILMRQCREVVVCSPALAASKGSARRVRLIPNAVDVARYRAPTERPLDLPAGDHAVYVGTLHEDRLDVALVESTARALASHGATLTMIGPNVLSAAHTERLAAVEGLALLGPRPHHLIPAYLQHAAALVVPHIVDDFTDTLDPIKMYEYLAVGRPIISTPVAGFRDLGSDGVILATTGQFPQAVVDVLLAPDVVLATVDVPDWDERVHAMGDVLDPLWGSGSARS